MQPSDDVRGRDDPVRLVVEWEQVLRLAQLQERLQQLALLALLSPVAGLPRCSLQLVLAGLVVFLHLALPLLQVLHYHFC
jgi:hypothetical protein